MEYELQGYYGDEHGWETILTEETEQEIADRKAEYDENENAPHRIVKK